MNESTRPKDLLPQALHLMVITAVPLAAFLGFAIQPIFGKQLLPMYGGTAGTWLGCMVYFQLALLLGYSWAAWLVRKPRAFQFAATAILAVLAVVSFHLPSSEVAEAPGPMQVVWRLSLASLPAMILLFSTSPLLHGWLQRRHEEVPYYLYAISNAGSLLALALYPFAIEVSFGLHEQANLWHAGLLFVALLLAGAGYIFRQTSASDAPVTEADEPLHPGSVALWLWLSMLTCVGMLGATHHLVAEIGSTPLAWVGPFGLYLFSFMVTFAGRWQRWMTMAAIVLLTLALAWFMMRKGFMDVTVNGTTLWSLLALTACTSFLGNALLHGARPARRFERFYLVLAAGGVLGGLASSTIIPYIFSRPIEFEVAAAAVLATGLIWLTGRREISIAIILASVVAVGVFGIGFNQARQESSAKDVVSVRHLRDFYGHIIVKTTKDFVILSSDTTIMGSQIVWSDSAMRRPTLYYSESTGIGRVMERMRATRPQMNVGVIGLGAGTLAAYSRAGDVYDFWDIDPKSIRVARDNFSYIHDAAGKMNLIQRDGRKALEDSKTNYDVLVVDAFTGDGVPSHLLTKEAVELYMRRLAARDGLLLFHTSVRYSQYFPVVEAIARSLYLDAIDVRTDVLKDVLDPGKERDFDPTGTEYIIVTRPEHTKDLLTWFPDEEDNGRVKRLVSTGNSRVANPDLIWTDDRNAEIQVLNLGRLLSD